MEKNYDCVIIGAGNAGLSATLNLCNQGLKTLLLERNNKVGGYATSKNKRDFRFEVSLHNLSHDIFDIIKDLNINLKVVEIKDSSIIINNKHQKYNYKIESYQKLLIERYPKSEIEIVKFLEFCMKSLPILLKFMNKKESTFKIIIKNLKESMAIKKYINMNAQEILDSFFQDEDLKTEIFNQVFYFGCEMNELSGVVFIYALTDSFINGTFYIEGGSQALTDELERQIKKKNGDILCNCELKTIITDKNLVKSIIVNLNGKEEEFKVNNLIYCADLLNLYKILDKPILIGDVISNKKIVSSIMTIHLGLDIDLKNYGYDTFFNVMINKNQISEFAVYSNVDKKCCKTGNSIITLTKIQDFDKEPSKDADEMYNKFIKLINIKNIEDHIIQKVVMKPKDFYNLTLNHKGSFGGFKTTNKMVNKMIPYTTSSKNLFLAGQWIGIGAGYINTLRGGIEVSNIFLKSNKESYKEIWYKF